MINPSFITVVRLKKRRGAKILPVTFAQRQRDFLRRETIQSFIIELLVFALLAASSVWQLLYAMQAFRLL